MGREISEDLAERTNKLRAINRLSQQPIFTDFWDHATAIQKGAVYECIDKLDKDGVLKIVKSTERSSIYSLGVKALREIAPAYRIKNYSRLSKIELLREIVEADKKMAKSKRSILKEIDTHVKTMTDMFEEFNIKPAFFRVKVEADRIPLHILQQGLGWLTTVHIASYKEYVYVKGLLTPEQWHAYYNMFPDEMKGFQEVMLLNACKKALRRNVFKHRPELFNKREMRRYGKVQTKNKKAARKDNTERTYGLSDA